MSAAPTWTSQDAEYARFATAQGSTVINAGIAKQWAGRLTELLRLRDYQDNWDGFGAQAPDPFIVDTAIAFLHALRDRDFTDPPQRVTLSPDGLVAIEWQIGAEFIRAEIGDGNDVEWMRARPGEETDFWTEPLPQMGEQAWQQLRRSPAAGAAVSASAR